MSLLKLPKINADIKLASAKFDLRPDALEQWEPGIKSALEKDNTISIYDSIGGGWWTSEDEGVTSKRISAALRSIGNRDVVVNINSPGGDFFEGVAIYNMLLAHPAKVTVNILGLAASAASVVAMAGDEINVGDGSFLMIHNAWAVAIGNRHDMRESADRLEPFDKSMVNLYSARTGIGEAEIARMMDKETWISSEQALRDGFATGEIEKGSLSQDANAHILKKPLAAVEAAMAKSGYSRSQRRDILKNLFSGTPSATTNATPSAGDDIAAMLQTLIDSMKGN